MHPIRTIEVISPVSVQQLDSLTYVVDFGTNVAGVTELSLEGRRGTQVDLIHGERLLPNGRVDLSNIDIYHRPQAPDDLFQTDRIILSGEGLDQFTPQFNYKGFRYVEVKSSSPLHLDSDNIKA